MSHPLNHPLDECRCGDYRRSHEGGTGVCSVCAAINTKFLEKCQKFRLHAPARQKDVDRFKHLGIEYPDIQETQS